MGYLLFIPIPFTFIPMGVLIWASIKATDYVEEGRTTISKGIGLCVLYGGLSILIGWAMGILGYTEVRPDGVYQVTYPIGGWASIIGGAVIIAVGIYNITKYKRVSQVKSNSASRDQNQEDNKKHMIITCGACYTKFPVKRGQGVITVKCPNCQRESRITT